MFDSRDRRTPTARRTVPDRLPDDAQAVLPCAPPPPPPPPPSRYSYRAPLVARRALSENKGTSRESALLRERG